MGFTTGLLGGFTLTTAVVYASLTLHNQTRLRQAALLQQQTQVINAVTNPQSQLITPAEREVRMGLGVAVKDKWNASLEQGIRYVQHIDWHKLWSDAENEISLVYRKAFETGREALPNPKES